MSLEKIYITGTPGLTYVQDPRLCFVEIMLGLREDNLLVETSGTPTGKQFLHTPADGKVQLDADMPIAGNPATDVGREEFYFQYKS